MTIQMLTLDDVKYKSVEELLRVVSTDQQVLRITLPNGTEVIIQSLPQLQPLPTLEGFVPKGWKDAIYNHAE
jgi:nitrogen fixation protein